jgi:hypothetical protein
MQWRFHCGNNVKNNYTDPKPDLVEMVREVEESLEEVQRCGSWPP